MKNLICDKTKIYKIFIRNRNPQLQHKQSIIGMLKTYGNSIYKARALIFNHYISSDELLSEWNKVTCFIFSKKVTCLRNYSLPSLLSVSETIPKRIIYEIYENTFHYSIEKT